MGAFADRGNRWPGALKLLSSPMSVPEGWEQAAVKINFTAALADAQNLTRAQYEALHDSGTAEGLDDPNDGFVIDEIGRNKNPQLSDEGIEYYRFLN